MQPHTVDRHREEVVDQQKRVGNNATHEARGPVNVVATFLNIPNETTLHDLNLRIWFEVFILAQHWSFEQWYL